MNVNLSNCTNGNYMAQNTRHMLDTLTGLLDTLDRQPVSNFQKLSIST